MKIIRVWHGYTTTDNADRYENLLKTEIFKSIEEKGVTGYQGIQLLRRSISKNEIEFITLMIFDSWEAVKAFAGEDYEKLTFPLKRAKFYLALMLNPSITKCAKKENIDNRKQGLKLLNPAFRFVLI